MFKRILLGMHTIMLFLALAITPVSAHHGWSGQNDDQFQLSGTLHRGLSMSGPHATMQIADGSGQVWDITMGPPARTRRAGLTEETIPVGADVSIRGNRNANPQSYEVKTVRVTYGGINYDVYPNRIT
ncbi:MAG: hypothetical protein CMM56_06070 [Rhodospirillaceae bacterium]|nr:hypothetical protein [Rhodospirillaceae bacterium]|tara:strand:- start:5885 stop:6268 length:384 start_codon:yes stop_codon:yes gene_type:complete